jgi:chromosome segregation ATPase
MPTDAPRSIETLKAEYTKLNERKIQAETQLDGAKDQLANLQAEAEAEFGTSNLDELTKKLSEMEAENEKQRSEYQSLLDKISRDLAAIEKGGEETAS